MTIRIAVALALAVPTTALAATYPPMSLTNGRAVAVTAMKQVRPKTVGSTASGVSRCYHPRVNRVLRAAFVDCNGWVKVPSKSACHLHVRVHDSAEGPAWSFVGAKTCGSASKSRPGGLSSPGTTIY